jgi:hypothetical protein
VRRGTDVSVIRALNLVADGDDAVVRLRLDQLQAACRGAVPEEPSAVPEDDWADEEAILVDEAVALERFREREAPQTTRSAPGSSFSRRTSSLAGPDTTRASSQLPHGARSSVRENTTLGFAFSASAMSCVSIVCSGQYSANMRYVTAPRRTVSSVSMNANCCSTNSPPVGSLDDSVTKSSAPFGPAAKPSRVTNCWTTSFRILRRA